ncbi:MAG: hypothetical protein OXD31_15890 [Chloroflexi bacterium]|nr:hypothetical protein [Chloroflexota bacterium]
MSRDHSDESRYSKLYLVPSIILTVLIGCTAFLAAMSWILLFLAGTDNPYFTGTPFGIAGACAIFGGMGYAAGFSSRGTPSIRDGMLATGTLYFVAALALTLTGMLVASVHFTSDGSPMQDFIKNFMNVAVAVSAVVAMLAFAAGTTTWGYIFPKIILYHLDRS